MSAPVFPYVPQIGQNIGNIIAYVRRIIKSSSVTEIDDYTILDYINRFYINDMPERVQLFELKRQYTFETVPNNFEYQAPFFYTTGTGVQEFPGNATGIPVYQMFKEPIYCDGVKMGFYQSNEQFYNVFPELVLNTQQVTADGTTGPYDFVFTRSPVLRAFIDDLGNLCPYVYITALDSSLQQHYIVDSGYFDSDGNGVLIETDPSFQTNIGTPLVFSPGTSVVTSGGAGTVDYITGTATATFASAVPNGNIINLQTSPYSAGVPRIALYFNNIFKLYPVPDKPYKIQIDAFITPTMFLSTSEAVPFAYMSDYIALGASRKIMRDTGDRDQIAFYEPFFREEECKVLRRSERIRGNQRTPTIFSSPSQQSMYLYTQY